MKFSTVLATVVSVAGLASAQPSRIFNGGFSRSNHDGHSYPQMPGHDGHGTPPSWPGHGGSGWPGHGGHGDHDDDDDHEGPGWGHHGGRPDLKEIFKGVDIEKILESMPDILKALMKCTHINPKAMGTRVKAIAEEHGEDISSLSWMIPGMISDLEDVDPEDLPFDSMLAKLPILLSAVFSGGCPGNETVVRRTY